MYMTELNINENVKKTFDELIKKERLPHAILIDGSDRETRDSVALYLAASFVCESNDKPCGQCRNCIKATDEVHPDIIIVDPDSVNEKTFKVSLVREIRSDAFIIPNEALKKVYILRSADKMNIQAQNALLKILEEPPSYVRFILECDSKTSMLETIISRVSSFNLGVGGKTAEKNAEKADELSARLAEALLLPTEAEFMKLTSELEKDKELLPTLLPFLQLIFRDAAVISTNGDILLSNHTDISRKLASKIPLKTLTVLVKNCDSFNESINRNANKNLLITRFCSVMRQTAYGG